MESKSNFDEIYADEDEPEEIIGRGGTSEDNEFDRIVGALEEILVDATSGFTSMQKDFCDKHCGMIMYLILYNQFLLFIAQMFSMIQKKIRLFIHKYSMSIRCSLRRH